MTGMPAFTSETGSIAKAGLDLSKVYPKRVLHAAYLPTPLGPMLAIADAQHLYQLSFLSTPLTISTTQSNAAMKSVVSTVKTPIHAQIQEELDAYYSGDLRHFKTPMFWIGTAFQQKSWQALLDIPWGQTRSYKEQACQMHRPTAFRAIANANNANPFSIIVPCHRAIRHNGDWGGYKYGIARKQWLLQHEQSFHS